MKRRTREKKILKIIRENRDNIIVESDEDIINSLVEHGIGEKVDNRKIKVTRIELAYLATRFKIFHNNRELDIKDIVRSIDNMLKFIVYLDLRKRGYDVKITPQNSSIDLLVWEKGKRPINTQPKYGVKIVTEGLGIKVLDLSSILKYCESMGLQLVLALISNDGIVTYYKAFSLK